MAESSESEKKLSEKPLSEKKPFWGVPVKPFVNKNPSFNKSSYGWKWGGGKPVIRKHAARSR